MKFFHIFIILLSLFVFSCKKEKIPIEDQVRYNWQIFDDFDQAKDILYANNITQGGVSQDLFFNVYLPKVDTETNRPVLIFAHGGGFTAGNKKEADFFAPQFARSGYVVISIDYRLIDVEETQEALLRGLIDASADMKAAIRYVKTNSNALGINPNRIFIGGYSAGSLTALQTAYVNSMNEIEQMGGQDLVDYVNANGGLAGNSGNPGDAFPIRGVFNFAGALSSADFVNSGEPVLFSVHGTADDVVPFGRGTGDSSGLPVEGSEIIHQAMDNEGIFNQLIAIENQKHDALFNCDDCLLEFQCFIFDQLN